MGNKIEIRKLKIIQKITAFDRRHPYFIAFFISAILMFLILFKASFYNDIESAQETVTQLEFISMDEMKAPKRKVSKEITTEPADDTNETADFDRAVGTSDAEDAIDISFYPNIAQPKVIGKLKRIYPTEAMTDEIEATVNVELLISSEGKVLKVTILGIRLNKDLPPDRYAAMSESFIRDVKKILNGARFTPPIVNGHAVPIRMTYPFKFKLIN